MSSSYQDHICCSCSHGGRTPTPRTHMTNGSTPKSKPTPRAARSADTTTKARIGVVFIVTDTCYPKETDFAAGNGATRIDSVHTTQKAANLRAKKIIYENDGGCTVDIDKIIGEERDGLYTGIGIGGKEEKQNCCYARKCEVEKKMIDEDSDDEWSGRGRGEYWEEEDHKEEQEAAATGADDDSKGTGYGEADGKGDGDEG